MRRHELSFSVRSLLAALLTFVGACGASDPATTSAGPIRVRGHAFLLDVADRAKAEGAELEALSREGLYVPAPALEGWRWNATENLRREGDDLVGEMGPKGFFMSPSDWEVDARQVEQLVLRIDTGAKKAYSRVRISWKNSEGGVGNKIVGISRTGMQTYSVDLRSELGWVSTIRDFKVAPRVGKEGWTVRVAPLEFRGQLLDFGALRAGTDEVRLGRVFQHAFFTSVPGVVRFPVEFSAEPRLHMDLGFLGHGANVRFRVAGDVNGREVELFRRELGTDEVWEYASIDLGELAGETGELILRAEPVEGSSAPAVACWGDPVLRDGAAPKLTNAFFHLADTLRADHLPTYGYDGSRTPNLDELEGTSVVFENCISQGNCTNVAMPSIFTSTFPSQHGVPHERRKTPLELATMPEVFRAAGYRTVSFYTNRIVGHMQGLNRGFSALYDYSTRFQGKPARVGDLPDPVLPWITAHRDEPMFVYVHTLEPHHPYIPQGRFRIASEYRGPIDTETFRDAKTSEELAHVLTLYDSEIQYMDFSLGRLVRKLRDEGLFDDSLFVFTSDHGEQFLEHGGWLHSKGLYDHQVHVPLVVHLPGGARGGERDDRTVRSIDILPTVLAALGLPALPHAEGIDLFAADAQPPAWARSEHLRRDGASYESVRGSRWKVVRVTTPDGDVTTELFDLENDPREQSPLSLERGQSAPTPEAAQAIAALDRLPEVRWETSTEVEEDDLDTRDLDQLRELGYIE